LVILQFPQLGGDFLEFRARRIARLARTMWLRQLSLQVHLCWLNSLRIQKSSHF